MNLKRLAPGQYQSHDGRVQIWRDVSQCTGHADEICWCVRVDGYELPRAEDTKRAAVAAAERRLASLLKTLPTTHGGNIPC